MLSRSLMILHSEIRSLPVRTIIIEVVTLAAPPQRQLCIAHCRSRAPPYREISAQRTREDGGFGSLGGLIILYTLVALSFQLGSAYLSIQRLIFKSKLSRFQS